MTIETTQKSNQPTVPATWKSHAAAWLFLSVFTFVFHGWSLTDGLFLDDHWHQSQLQAQNWSVDSPLHATTIEPDQLMEHWWSQKHLRWQYSRPVAVLLAKGVHELSGGSPVAHHAVSIAVHILAVCLLYELCALLTARKFWAMIGAMVFAVYAHSVFTVAWLAAQNVVLQTTLLLASLLCYLKASGFGTGPLIFRESQPPLRLRKGFFALAIGLWILSLFTRESSIMLAAIFPACDLAFGGKRHLWARRWAYGLVALLGFSFLIWRLVFFYHPMPDVYVRRYDGEGYILWWFAKLAHYLCAIVWQSPMTIGPSGRYNPFSEVPGDCILTLAIVAIISAVYFAACRKCRGFWIWPAWILLSVLPVIAIMATPHSGYLGGVGFAVGVCLLAGSQIQTARRWCKGLAIATLVATCTYFPIYRATWNGICAAEQVTLEELKLDSPPSSETDIYFINLPFVNIYAHTCLQEIWGNAIRNVRTHALTYSPGLLRMEQPCILKQIDDYSFSVEVSDRHYFSGYLGRFLISSMRKTGCMQPGDIEETSSYEVQIDSLSEEGANKLTFRFYKPLTDDSHRFYLTSKDFGTIRLEFFDSDRIGRTGPVVDELALTMHNVCSAVVKLASGEYESADLLIAAIDTKNGDVREKALLGFIPVAECVARATGSPIQSALNNERAEESWPEIRSWWTTNVNGALLERVMIQDAEFAELRDIRQNLFNVRSTAAKVISTDMYMGGPKYPGPRCH